MKTRKKAHATAECRRATAAEPDNRKREPGYRAYEVWLASMIRELAGERDTQRRVQRMRMR